MIKHGILDLEYKNGLMKIKTESNRSGMTTPQQFKLPLKIELRAKTDNTKGRITIMYAKGEMALNWDHIPTTLLVSDISDGKYVFYKKRGQIPVDEFVDIEWILGKDVTAIKMNGEIRNISDDFGYIRAFEENPDINLLSSIIIAAAWGSGSTLTVEKLRVTEI